MLQRNRFVGGAMYVYGPTSGSKSRIYIAPSHDEIQIIIDFVDAINEQHSLNLPHAQWSQCMD